MNEIGVAAFQHAIRSTHGVGSQFKWREHVHEVFEGETVWVGEVLMFELEGHPTATRCFAWEIDGEGPVQTAPDAVRASIMAEDRPVDGT